MSAQDIQPYQIAVGDSDLDLLTLRIKNARLPANLGKVSWSESSDETINLPRLHQILDFWKNGYSWRKEEERLNKLPHFQTKIPIDSFGTITTHFLHATSPTPNATPLLFLHGWPGSFLEISKALPLLQKANFHVVAPSHAGWAFSSYPDKAGFKLPQYAEAAHKLMLQLGYTQYFVQGGDWGAHIGRVLALLYPKAVLGLHLNNIGGMGEEPAAVREARLAGTLGEGGRGYTDFEEGQIRNAKEFLERGHAYAQIQHDTPLALGVAMHDSPMGLLAYMTEKILSWSDSYPKNPEGYMFDAEELITWTLVHYFSTCGPLGGFAIYSQYEDGDLFMGDRDYIEVPTGVSAFKAEAEMVPRCWVETVAKVVWYKEKLLGGHFAMYEQPPELVCDIVDFVAFVRGDSAV